MCNPGSSLCNPGSSVPHSTTERELKLMQTALGHGVLSMLPAKNWTPDARVSTRRKASLCSASAYLTRAAQWISPSRLRMPHEYPIRASVLRALQWGHPLANGWRLLWTAAAYSISGSLCAGGACCWHRSWHGTVVSPSLLALGHLGLERSRACTVPSLSLHGAPCCFAPRPATFPG